jgi:hypothetical protein
MSGLFAGLDLSAVAQDIKPDANNTRKIGAASLDWAEAFLRVFKSSVADGAAAVAHIFDTVNDLATGGALLASWRRQGVEKAKLSNTGVLTVEQLLPTAAAAKQLGGQSNDWALLYTRGINSSVPDGAAAVGIALDAPNLATDGSRIITAGVNGAVKFSVDRLGKTAIGFATVATALLSLKGHAAFAGSEAQRDTAAVQTTDATVTTLFSKTLSDNTLYYFEVSIIGRDAGGTNRAYYQRKLRVHRQGGGGATAGTIQTPVTDESNAAWDATIDVNGNDVRVRVTGAAGVTINWACEVRWQAVSGNA